MIKQLFIDCLGLALFLVPMRPPEVRAVDRLAQDPVIVKVCVLNEATGAPVLNLSENEFVIEENGDRQKPTRFLREEQPFSILIAIDASGSMRPIIQPIIQAVSQALKQLKPDDEVGLMCFNEQAYFLQSFTKNKSLPDEKLKEIVARRATLTRQALLQASTNLLSATSADNRRIIVVLTDNLSSTPGDVTSEEAVMKHLTLSDAVVVGISVSNPIALPPEGLTGPIIRREPTSITPYVTERGGIMEAVKKVTPGEISGRLIKTINTFRSHYRIEYFPTNLKRDGKHRRIKVTLSSGAKNPGGKLKVLAKRGYFAPNDTK